MQKRFHLRTQQWVSFFLIGLTLLFFQNCSPGFEVLRTESSQSSAMRDPASLSEFQKGEVLYTKNCQSCHGELSVSTKRKADEARVTLALSNVSTMQSLKSSLSADDVRLIALALQGPPVSAPACNTGVVGNIAAHRLSNYEYNNVIRDLTGIDSKPALKFPEDPFTGFFSNMATTLGVDQTLMTMYFDAAVKTIDDVFVSARGRIVTCSPTTLGERACAEKVIREFGLKAFRRPLSAIELQKYVSLYEKNRQSFPSGAAGSAFDEGLKSALQGMLVSTKFIYRIIDMPSADPSFVKALGPYEVASRLSFFLWGSFPDQILFDLAASGQILNKTVMQQQVDRMLKDPKASYLVDVFATQWLKLYKLAEAKPDAGIYPAFDESIRSAMMTESKLLLSDIIQKDASPYLILNADYTYINAALGSLYGVSGAPASGFGRVSLANTARVGILTHGSLLTTNSKINESSIIRRGLWALDRILCTDVGSPPPEALANPPVENFETLNPRLSLAAHTNNVNCASCHRQIDPVGFGLENFDGIGAFRTRYRNGDVIDASGNFPDGKSFADAKQMSAHLVANPKFNSCYSRNLMSFSLGRVLTAGDACAADTFGSGAVSPTNKFSDLVKKITISEQFLKQKGGN